MNLNKDPSSWAKVEPKIVAEGSRASMENVLRMALEDIARLDRAIEGARAQLHAVHKVDKVPFLRGAIGAALQALE